MNGRSGVIVVGSVHTDLIATADAMPTPGSSVLGTRFTLAPGGKAGNQAAQLARLGVPTVLISRIGTDSLGNVIAAQLAGTGIDLTYLARSDTRPDRRQHGLRGEWRVCVDHRPRGCGRIDRC